jgi:hypothetical protein
MSASILILHDFAKLFAGNTSARGVNRTLDEKDKNGKALSENRTEKGPVTEEHYLQHLEGRTGLGIIPIDEEGKCRFSVIDVDVYGKDHSPIIENIVRNNLPLLPFRSKSGGLHLYLFWEGGVKASASIETMNVFRQCLMLNKKTEIFPKQSSLTDGNFGSWINLPYFDFENTNRYMIGEKGRKIEIDEALYLIQDRLQTKATAKAIIDSLPLSDAPPCLQGIYIARTTDSRKRYLFSLASYYQAKHGDDFEFKLMDANNLLDAPVDVETIQKTVIASHKKTTYKYKCEEDPLVSICDKEECSKRRYGIGGMSIPDISFGDFKQIMSDPPRYEWIVNDKALRFYDETDIIMQKEFRKLCMRSVGILPATLTDKVWTGIINKALANKITVPEDNEGEISPGALFKEHLTEFLTDGAMAMNKLQVLADRVYRDDELQGYVFKPKRLLLFLIQQKQFRYFGLAEIQDRLSSMGAVNKRYYVDAEHRSARVWIMPYISVAKYIDASVEDVRIDFMEDHKDEQF